MIVWWIEKKKKGKFVFSLFSYFLALSPLLPFRDVAILYAGLVSWAPFFQRHKSLYYRRYAPLILTEINFDEIQPFTNTNLCFIFILFISNIYFCLFYLFIRHFFAQRERKRWQVEREKVVAAGGLLYAGKHATKYKKPHVCYGVLPKCEPGIPHTLFEVEEGVGG